VKVGEAAGNNVDGHKDDITFIVDHHSLLHIESPPALIAYVEPRNVKEGYLMIKLP